MTIQVFDPAMCCSTGVCGPTVDARLPQFAADLEWVRSQGHTVERFNLSQQPQAFVQNAIVQKKLQTGGTECLPLILVEGKIASEGQYLEREVLASLVGLPTAPSAASSSGCKPSSGCCG